MTQFEFWSFCSCYDNALSDTATPKHSNVIFGDTFTIRVWGWLFADLACTCENTRAPDTIQVVAHLTLQSWNDLGISSFMATCRNLLCALPWRNDENATRHYTSVELQVWNRSTTSHGHQLFSFLLDFFFQPYAPRGNMKLAIGDDLLYIKKVDFLFHLFEDVLMIGKPKKKKFKKT